MAGIPNKKNVFSNKAFSNSKVIDTIGWMIVLAGSLIAWSMKGSELAEALRSASQLNITVAIGVAAISISLKHDKRTYLFLKETIFIMMVSILSYYLSFLPIYNLQRLYLFISCLVLVLILRSIVMRIDIIENSKKYKRNIVKGKGKKKRK